WKPLWSDVRDLMLAVVAGRQAVDLVETDRMAVSNRPVLGWSEKSPVLLERHAGGSSMSHVRHDGVVRRRDEGPAGRLGLEEVQLIGVRPAQRRDVREQPPAAVTLDHR